MNDYFFPRQDAEQIPDGAAYQLRDLANRLEVSEGVGDKATLDQIKIVEAKRILNRKEGSEEALLKLKICLNDISKALKEEHLAKGKTVEDFVDKSVKVLAEELIIAKIFADAKDLAGVKE